MKTRTTRMGVVLVVSLLAVVLPQQNTLGEVINTEGTGDASMRDVTLSGIEVKSRLFPG